MTQAPTRDRLADIAHLWLSAAPSEAPRPTHPAAPAPTVPLWALLADPLAAAPLKTAAALADFWSRQGGRLAIVEANADGCRLLRPGPDGTPRTEGVVYAPEALAGRAAIRRNGPATRREADLADELQQIGQWANRVLLIVETADADAALPLLASAETLLLAIRPARKQLLAAYRTLKRVAAILPDAHWAAICLDAASAADGAETMARLRDTAADHLDLDVTDAGFLLAEPGADLPTPTPLAQSDSLAPLHAWLGRKKGSWTLLSERNTTGDNALETASECRTPSPSLADDTPVVVPLLGDAVTSEALLRSILAELDLVLPGVQSANGSARPDERPIARLMDAHGRGVLLAASVDDPIFLLADLAELLIADGLERRILLIHRDLPPRTAALIRCLKFDVDLLRATPVRLPTGAGMLLDTEDVDTS